MFPAVQSDSGATDADLDVQIESPRTLNDANTF